MPFKQMNGIEVHFFLRNTNKEFVNGLFFKKDVANLSACSSLSLSLSLSTIAMPNTLYNVLKFNSLCVLTNRIVFCCKNNILFMKSNFYFTFSLSIIMPKYLIMINYLLFSYKTNNKKEV